MDFSHNLQTIYTLVAVVTGGLALFSRFPDRRRQRFREQHQTLAAFLKFGGEPQHDLVIESAFRAAFEASVPLSLVRYFSDNRFPLIAVEQYCDVREYLDWDEARAQIGFRRRRHERTWARRALTGLWVGAYVGFAMLAFGSLRLRGTNPVSQVALFGIFALVAFMCLRQGSLLSRAGKFVRELEKYATPRSPRIAAERDALADPPLGTTPRFGRSASHTRAIPPVQARR